MARITLNVARRRLRAVAADRLDYVYKPPLYGDCVYVNPDGTPSCIIGAAFADELREAGIDHYEHGLNGGADVLTLVKRGVLDATDKAADFLVKAQASQDRGTPWGVVAGLR